MKTINILFWIITVLIGLQCLLFTFRGIAVAGSSDELLQLMWGAKILTYAGIAGMGFYIFQIKNAFKRTGFLSKSNVKHLRIFGFLGLISALFNSLANAAMETKRNFQSGINWKAAQEMLWFNFTEQVFDQSLIVYILVLSVILLAFFTSKALAVKGENEAFI